MKISLLTGGKDPHYVLGLLSGLSSKAIIIDLIGSYEMKDTDIVSKENVNFYKFLEQQKPYASIKEKTYRIFKYYFKLIKYTTITDSKLFHIQWFSKFVYFERIFLNIYYKLLGKKVVFTAHNINAAERDGNDTLINKLSLKFMYKIVDHLIVHTKEMKWQLIEEYYVRDSKVTVISFGINNLVPKSELTRIQAIKKLHLGDNEKIILFFGNIAPYKGLEYLILALVKIREKHCNFKLIIAGRIKKGCQSYWENIQKIIKKHNLKDYIIKRIEFIHDEEIEIYYKAADLMVLPYKYIFQSGIIFMSYSFGLPVIASDVGSLKEDVVEGKTGFICQPKNPEDLAKKINLYFKSDLYKNLETNRNKIIKYANEKYSWEKIGEKTHAVYKSFP